MKNQAAVALGKLSRRRLTAKRRREIARTAARARWARARLCGRPRKAKGKAK
jgi:hypothetical protein